MKLFVLTLTLNAFATKDAQVAYSSTNIMAILQPYQYIYAWDWSWICDGYSTIQPSNPWTDWVL